MFRAIGKPDVFHFGGAKKMNYNLNNGAASDEISATDIRTFSLPITAHGLFANTLIYIQGTTNFDGMRYIHSIAANAITCRLAANEAYPAADETVSSGDLWFPGVKMDCYWAFLGFKLHLSSVGLTDEDFEILIDADKGTYWDTKIYDDSMIGVTDVIEFYEKPILIAPNDIVKATYANTDTSNWGLEMWAQRVQA